jgi:uncharacterized protein YpiB (UPF0302 family)
MALGGVWRMDGIIPVVEKKDFLRWFLKEFTLKKRECSWLLNYLMSDDDLMENVHFVEEAERCPKALIMSTNDVHTVPFCFHKYQQVTMDAEKAFHDIRMNPEEAIYIQLHFSGAKHNPNYIAVLEDNPYVPENEDLIAKQKKLAEAFLERSVQSFEEKELLRRIDEALDARDKETFLTLSQQLQHLRQHSD